VASSQPAGYLASGPSPPLPIPARWLTRRSHADCFNATIYLDDRLLVDPHGESYVTPCTVPALPARAQHVRFHNDACGDRDAGVMDLSQYRDVVAHWE
jgi:hypothetical protein